MARKVTEQERKFADEIFRLRSISDLDGAVAECDRALEYFGQFNFFHKIKGDLLYEKKDFDRALDSYLVFLERIKDEPEYFTNFSKFFLKLNRVKRMNRAVFERLAQMAVRDDYTYSLCKGILKLILDTYVMPPEVKQAVWRGQQTVSYDTVKADHAAMEKRGKCEEIVYLCRVIEKECTRSQDSVNVYLLKHLERNRLYEQALEWVKRMLDYSRDWVVAATLFRLCRESDDYGEARVYLQSHDIIHKEEFNIQYELVLYFDAVGDVGRRNNALDCIERLSENRIPICRALFKLYVRFDMLDRAQNIRQKITEYERNGNTRRKTFEARAAEREAQTIVWERLRTLVSEQEHNRQLLAMSELMKGFSHELGQPITNIRYAVQFFYMRRKKEQRAVGEEEQELLDGVLRQTERVGKLLNRFSLIFSSKSEKAYFNVYQAVRTVFDELSSRLANEEIVFTLEGTESARIYGEELQFSQIFYNLVINSIYAIKKKGSQGKIEVVLSHRPGLLKIIFTDNGTGIPKELQRKIFEPFFSTKKRETEEGGEGLGLFIVWNILKLFNGSIYVDGAYEEGARFVIEIQSEEQEHV